MNNQQAAAVICRRYLKETGSKVYDLREYEERIHAPHGGFDITLMIESLIADVSMYTNSISDEERLAMELLDGIEYIVEDKEFVLELMRGSK